MKELKQKLKELKDNYHLIGIKGGTEVEAMSFEEIYLMRQISNGVVPMTVKIGGPEARNDIEFMLSIGIDQILAPMIESPYSLKNFVETLNELDKFKNSKLAINLETIFAYNNINYIFKSEFFQHIDQVTVGRSDLSGSMNKDVDDSEVFDVTKKIIQLSKYFGKKTSVGGKINTGNVVLINDRVQPDFINTRHMIISCDSLDIVQDVSMALKWEKEFYEYLECNFSNRKEFYLSRIKSIDDRIKVSELCYTAK